MDQAAVERQWEAACEVGPDYLPSHSPQVALFAAAIRAAALEEAAKVCELLDAGKQPRDQYADGQDCAAAIRALK